MKTRIIKGLLIGIVAGIIDVIPMLAQGLTWDANIAAFLLWVVVGFMIATSSLKMAGVLKGILLSVLCLLPSIPIIGWKEPASLIPVIIMTLILGALAGLVFNRLTKDRRLSDSGPVIM